MHQLKEENIDLKDSVDQYVQRRDHLLAVRARLMALNNLTVTSVSGSNNSASTLVTTIGVGGSNPSTSSEVGDGIAHGLLNKHFVSGTLDFAQIRSKYGAILKQN